ncbi:putative nuclease HARBI1 [Chelonus insularis]|uniref:putative nuclease HARBI1 n=1 Tax=Chelonus insularis TaxID=460826 RepID=UPI00158DEC7B|nr:putative nuclease HARBI1 [Chelonus insularis]
MGDFTGISKSSVCHIIHRTSRAIASLRRYYIRFPTTPAAIRQIQKEDFHRAGFIRVIGAIDCMHVRVRSYAIVNSRLQIMDLVARWPGSTHDSTIFDHSLIKYRSETGEFGNSCLVGDCGYPALPYLMTPLINPRTAAEQLYNESQIRTRNMVERCFGIWGKIFAVLTIGSRFFNVESTLPVIVATAILYNLRMSVNPSPCLVQKNGAHEEEENTEDECDTDDGLYVKNENNSFVNDSRSLKTSYKARVDLENQVSMLEKDLKSATEVGLELECMLRELLAIKNEENNLAKTV